MRGLQFSRPLRRLLKSAAPYRRQTALGLACLLAASGFSLIIPYVLRHTIDDLVAEVTKSKLLLYGGLLVVIALAQGALHFWQRRVLVGMARDVEFDLRNAYYAHLQTLPQEFYHANRTGDLMARATSDLAVIRMFAGLGLSALLGALFSLVLIVPVMISVNWRLTLLAATPLILLAFITQALSKRIHESSKQVQALFGKVSTGAQEALTGVRVTRAYGQEENEIISFHRVNSEYVRGNLRLIHLSSLTRSVLQFFVGLSFIAVFLYGSYLTINGRLTVGQLFQQTSYLAYLVGPMAAIGLVINQFQRAMASMQRIDAILSIEPAIRDRAAHYESGAISGEIEFRDLTFTYKGAVRPTLQQINLRIAPGETIAFVGPVGCGKTTLMNLVCRLLEAEHGQLLIDGQAIDDIPLQTLRSAIGYVPQETVLFSETIAENIAFGVNQARRCDVERVAAQAGIAKDINTFPQAYDTIIGERGLTLSGGQKQRTAIARALLAEPRIFILDDALSSVDSETEKEIVGSLHGYLRGRTTLIASHRISTVKDADLIVVLAEGRIVERGTHQELVARRGAYMALYSKQILNEELTQ